MSSRICLGLPIFLSVLDLYELIYPIDLSHLNGCDTGVAGYSAARTPINRFLWYPQHGVYASTTY
jgi:hypothetical protein